MTSVRASDLIGQRVKEIRDKRGWTAEQLAARCAEIGAPELTRSVLANIESGRRDWESGRRRRDVTVDEMLTLAYALEVQPPLLFTPLSGADLLQVTPATELDVIDALAWIDGGEAGIRMLAGSTVESDADEDRERLRRIRASSRPLNMLRAFWLQMYLLMFETGDIPTRSDRRRDALEDLAIENPGAVNPLRTIANLIDNLVTQGLEPPPIPAPIAESLRKLKLLQVADPDELLTLDGFTTTAE